MKLTMIVTMKTTMIIVKVKTTIVATLYVGKRIYLKVMIKRE